MRFSKLILATLLPLGTFAQEQDSKMLTLPISFVHASAPHNLVHGSAMPSEKGGEEGHFGKTFKNVKGMPMHWDNIDKGMIWLDDLQFVHQNYLAGNVSKEIYDNTLAYHKRGPDDANLVSFPIACYVYTASGEDSLGQRWLIVDQNNNLDFGDEQPFIPPPYNDNSSGEQQGTPTKIRYQRVVSGKVTECEILLSFFSGHEGAWYAIAQYGVVHIQEGNDSFQIAVVPEKPNYVPSTLVFLGDDPKQNTLPVSEGQFLLLGGKNTVYKHLGVDSNHEMLRLERLNESPQNIHSTQIHFKAHPFHAENFQSKSPISLEQFKGKYLFIDFWATWCGPCMKELPNVKKVFEQTDRSKIEFLGIVAYDEAASLSAVLEKKGVQWPQILSDAIVEQYGIQRFPTTLLIDPQGIIVAKDLRGEELLGKIEQIINGK